MRSISSIPLALLLASLVLSSALGATDYLIVTTDQLAPSLQDLADQKSLQGYSTAIITVESIQALATPGRDLAEQIRETIKQVYQAGSLRFVLLAGDAPILPTRFVHSDFYPVGGGTDIATDLYYATLDGDWDADGDDVFGELAEDLVDLEPDVAVGRAPVATPLEASAYCAKVRDYESPAHVAHLSSALFAAEVLFPSDWSPGQVPSFDGAQITEELYAIIQSAPTPLSATRFYENHVPYPGSLPLTLADALAAMSGGQHGLLVQQGHGYVDRMSMGDDIMETADAAGLTNGPNYFVAISPLPNGAAIELEPLLETLVLNGNGGAVAALGSSALTFPSSFHANSKAIVEELFLNDAPSLGEALNAVRTELAAGIVGSSIDYWAILTLNLLGDPELGVGPSATAVSAPLTQPRQLLMRGAWPNPFNPSTQIRFELKGDVGSRRPVTVAVYDAAGRRVVTLFDGPLGMGPHAAEWNGRDEAGRVMGSGAYFAIVESADAKETAKLILLK